MPTVPCALEGLELGPIVGKGSYGSVYRGSYQRQHVAVKARRGPLLERKPPYQMARVLHCCRRRPKIVNMVIHAAGDQMLMACNHQEDRPYHDVVVASVS